MTSDVSTDADIIPAAVQTFLNCNPPRLEWTDEIDDRPDLKPPFIFYERHLDARLMLRRVRIVPLESLLSAVVDISFSAIADKGIPLPKIQPDDLFGCLQFPETVGYSNNAGSVSDAYESYISIYSQSVASTVLLHPRASDWDSSLWWLDIAQTRKSSAASLDCYGLRLASTTTITESVLEVTDGEIRQFMETSHRPRHALAWWQLFFFDDEARVLLADMDRIAFSGAFHGSCGTTGYRPAPPGSFPVSPDASRTPWRSPMPSSDAETSESSNQPQLPAVSDPQASRSTGSRKTRSHTAILSRRDGNEKYRSNRAARSRRRPDYDTSMWPEVRPAVHESQIMDLFLLRAWGQSITSDTTFTIFHCGTHERIGFRHRESQTLYVSNLIDVHKCSNPPYGRLHTGLYLSILQDAMDRIKEQNERDAAKPKSRKRPKEPDDVEPSGRRYKTRSAVSKDIEEAENFEVVKQHASKRLLALVTLRFDNYNSIAPASFLRSGTKRQASYGPHEYMSVVLTSKLATGAIGDAHYAQIELLINGCARRTSAVVKLALQKQEIDYMRHEFTIYQHLYKCGVTKGIPSVLGFFEDIESGAAALIMSYVGKSICTLRPRYTSPGVKAPEAIKNAYIQVLKDIHRADVSHRDIREENLTLIDGDKVAIIDFDRAKLRASDLEKRMDLQDLDISLHGREVVMLEKEDSPPVIPGPSNLSDEDRPRVRRPRQPIPEDFDSDDYD